MLKRQNLESWIKVTVSSQNYALKAQSQPCPVS
jgi:hypothetical protein